MDWNDLPSGELLAALELLGEPLRNGDTLAVNYRITLDDFDAQNGERHFYCTDPFLG